MLSNGQQNHLDKSLVVVWDREDYLREAISQLKDKDMYWEVKGGVLSLKL